MFGFHSSELQQFFAADNNNAIDDHSFDLPSHLSPLELLENDRVALLPFSLEQSICDSDDDEEEAEEEEDHEHELEEVKQEQRPPVNFGTQCSDMPCLPWLDVSSDHLEEQSAVNFHAGQINNNNNAVNEVEDEEDTDDPGCFLSGKKRKKKVVSGKALRNRKQRDLHGRFSNGLSMLTLKPYLKNNDMLFGNIVNIVDACLWHRLKESKSKFINTLHESEFMNSPNLKKVLGGLSLNDEHPWFVAFVNLESVKTTTSSSKHQQTAVFVETKTVTMHVIDFQAQHMSKITPKTLETQLPQNMLQRKVKVSMHYFGSFLVPQRNRRTGALSNLFEMSLVCKKKLWNAMLFLMVLEQKRSPIDILQSLQLCLSNEDAESLLQLFAQSILYYAIENEEDIRSCSNRYFARHASQIDRLFENIIEQCNTKAVMPFKKHQSGNDIDRIGKFKGRQTDNLFCILVNGKVGVYVSFERLFTENVFEVLLYGAKWPHESGFNYADLHKYLPDVFPKDRKAKFGCNFQLKTPFITTCDPHVCCLPIKQQLWPNAETANDVVAFNGKTWKLEYFIEPAAIYDERNGLTKFINALNLGPHNMMKFAWNEWVSVIDENNTPLGIYYHDPSFSPEQAELHLKTIPGYETTEFQKPERMFAASQHSHQMLTVRFVRDKFHGIWKGSRRQGIAIRRHYKNGVVCIRTFKNARLFIEKAQCEDHGFIRVESFYHESQVPDAHASFTVWNAKQVEDMYNQLPQNTLMCVDDTGERKVYTRGHQPIEHFLHCANCEVAANDSEWARTLRLLPISECKVLPKITMWMPSQVQDYHVEYGRGHFKHHIVNKPNTKVIEKIQQMTKDSGNFSCFEVLCIRGQNIIYYSTFADLKAKIFSLASDQMTSLGVQHFKPLSFSDFEARLPQKPCKCCRSETLCTQAVASILNVINISIGGGIKNVNTTVTMLAGKILQAPPLSAAIGLRCKHNWTQGIKDVCFEVIVGKYEQPDIIVCTKTDAPNITRGFRTLRLL